MNAEVITTGTELLLGEIVNVNFPYLARNLNKRGFNVLYETTVGDNPRRLVQVLAAARERADIIITTGGLGPTRGDVTREALCSLWGLKLSFDAGVWADITAFMQKRGRQLTENNRQQAMVPEGAQVLPNPVGTAPGLWLEKEGKLYILLPGPPGEVKELCEAQVWPRLAARFGQEGIILSRTLHLRNIGESMAAALLDKVIKEQSNPTLALYARKGEILLRLTAKSRDEKEAAALLDPLEEKCRALLGSYVYGVDDATIAATVGKLLLKQKSTVALAESCSGGLASSLLTDVPGSSAYLLGSVVCYTEKVKEKIVGVKGETLARFTAVSPETACEMAMGIRSLLGSTYGIGITGNAGPEASCGKPAGLVYIALATEQHCCCQRYFFQADRTDNKMRIAQSALSMLLEELLTRETGGPTDLETTLSIHVH